MSSISSLRGVVLAALASAALCGGVAAQFPGDLYFQEPFVEIAAGSSGYLDVQTFMGSAVLGSVHFEMVYDPALLDISGLEPGAGMAPGQPFGASLVDRYGVVVHNEMSLSGPIGVLDLARVRVTPKAPVGTRITVVLVPRLLLDSGGAVPFPQEGFEAEIIVTEPGDFILYASADGGRDDAPVVAVADSSLRRFRRYGQVITVIQLVQQAGHVVALRERRLLLDPRNVRAGDG